MTIRNAAVIAVGLAFSCHCLAQQAFISCDSKAGELSIRYRASVEPETSVVNVQVIDFGSLVLPENCPAAGPCMITSLKQKTIACELSGASYLMTFRPVPGNPNRHGMCGGVISGKVEIQMNGKSFLAETQFDPGMCNDGDVFVLERIRVSAGADRPELLRRKQP